MNRIRAGQASGPAMWARAVVASWSWSAARSMVLTASARTCAAGSAWGVWGRTRSGFSGAMSLAVPRQSTVVPADQGLQATSAAMYRARSAP